MTKISWGSLPRAPPISDAVDFMLLRSEREKKNFFFRFILFPSSPIDSARPPSLSRPGPARTERDPTTTTCADVSRADELRLRQRLTHSNCRRENANCHIRLTDLFPRGPCTTDRVGPTNFALAATDRAKTSRVKVALALSDPLQGARPA